MMKKQPVWLRKAFIRGGQLLLGAGLFLILGLHPSLATLPAFHAGSALEVAASATTPTKAIAAEPAQFLQQGRDLYQAGRFSEAATIWQQAVDAYQAQADEPNRALALSYLSLAYQKLGQLPQAKQAIATSLDILKNSKLSTQNISSGDASRTKLIFARALNTQGSLQLLQGQAEQALATWKQAADAYTQAGDEAGRVGSLVNQAQAEQALGLYLQARKTLIQVEQALQKQSDPQVRVVGLRNLGDTFRALGDLDASQRLLEDALAASQTTELKKSTSDVLLSLGNTARAKKDTVAALNYYQKAAASTSVSLTQVQAQLNQLSLLLEAERWAEAQPLVEAIQSQIMTLPLSRSTVYAQINFVQSLMLLRQGLPTSVPNSTEIARIAANAVQQARDLEDRQAESYALGNLGGLYEENQQWGQAKDLTQKALVLAQSVNAPDIAYQWQWQLGRLLKVQGDADEAIAAYTEAVKTLGSLRSDLVAVNSDVQFSFRESVEPVYRQLVGLLLHPKTGEPSQASLKRAREVIESLQLAELDNFFREACLNARPSQIDKIDPKAAVIYSILLEDRLEVILSLPNQPLTHYATDISEEDAQTLIDRMLRSLKRTFPSRERLQVSQQLYNLLLRPAEAQLNASNIQTLVFVLDGSLQSLPMAALYDGKQYLVEKYSIALAPGLQLLAPQPLGRDQLKVLVGGLSEASQGFSALPGVEYEIGQISTEVPTEVLLNQDFTRTTLQNQIEASPYPVVHLATHGQFSSNAQDTFILAWDSPINVKQLDSFLRSREERDRRPIELLVLSACQTAAGDRRATLGIAGVAVRSGARSTLATLWSVDDQSTSFFMVQFYQELAKNRVNKAEALRQAQLALLKQPGSRHPYYWAPFVLVGNWL